MGPQPVNGKLLPAFFIIACLIPFSFGSYRLFEIIVTGSFSLELAPDHVDRIPLFLHVLGALGFLVIGAMQILPGLRYRHPSWHRRAGRLAAPLGLIGALAGLWMTLLHPEISSALLYWGRLGASAFWILAIGLGIYAINRRDFKSHGTWMIRAYAIALPAGTLAFVLLPFVLILGEEGHEVLLDAIQVLAWPIHLAVAEWLIQCKLNRPRTPVIPIPLLSQIGA